MSDRVCLKEAERGRKQAFGRARLDADVLRLANQNEIGVAAREDLPPTDQRAVPEDR